MTIFNETSGMNFTIVKNATIDEWGLIMSHVQNVSININLFYRQPILKRFSHKSLSSREKCMKSEDNEQ